MLIFGMLCKAPTCRAGLDRHYTNFNYYCYYYYYYYYYYYSYYYPRDTNSEMQDKPHKIKLCEIYRQSADANICFCIVEQLCTAVDSRTERESFYLSFDFHLQFTNESVGFPTAVCKSCKLLRVHINEHLKWDDNINTKKTEISHQIHV